MTGGSSERTKYIGMDQFGNKYYEDIDALCNSPSYIDFRPRRWVEYNDYLTTRSPSGINVPPVWHGWLSYQYDDLPYPDSDSFHHPFYEKPHKPWPSASAFTMHTYGKSIIDDKFLDYAKYRRNRSAKEWEPTTKREDKQDNQ
jgi:NADH:ubiquinone oxidoreductase subunit